MLQKNKNFFIALVIAVVISVIIGIVLISYKPQNNRSTTSVVPATTTGTNAAASTAQPAPPPKTYVRSRTIVNDSTFTVDYIKELESQGFSVQRGEGTNRYVAEKTTVNDNCEIKRIIAWNDVGSTVRNVSRATKNDCE